MIRRLPTRLALALILSATLATSHTMRAQSTSPCIVTGSDPQPCKPAGSIMAAILPVLIAFATS
jgi:prepilin signal peptidase PulO-like enzyme (type II secretory pathway)